MKYSYNGKMYSTETSSYIAAIIFNDGRDNEEAVEVMKTAKGTIWYYRESENRVFVLKQNELYDLFINLNGIENVNGDEIEGLAKYIASLEDA